MTVQKLAKKHLTWWNPYIELFSVNAHHRNWNLLRFVPENKSSTMVNLKVKCTLVQALRLCRDRTAHKGSRVIALLFLDHGTRRGWGVSVTPWPLFTPGKDSVPFVQEAGWAPRLVWTGAENLAPTRVWSLDHPASSQSLYWLHYPANSTMVVTGKRQLKNYTLTTRLKNRTCTNPQFKNHTRNHELSVIRPQTWCKIQNTCTCIL